MSKRAQRMINVSGTSGETDKEASSGFLANDVKRSKRKEVRNVFSCQFWFHFCWTYTGELPGVHWGSGIFSCWHQDFPGENHRFPPDSFGTHVGSHCDIKFGNPAHIRHLKIVILELSVLQFNILKLGYFDILKVGVLVFWKRIILVFWNMIF